uniref:HotDog ACOT-type domain-containing protein n=1 Tax=Pavo cristatus TaxID=9049 RepID=A0A8C9LA91_PAVCR
LFTVLICYTHTKQEMQPRSPLSIVTALVDKINLCKKVIYPDCDIKFTGNVSWVGKTSMEVKMHMLQLHDGDYSPVLDATFVMVARDPENKRPAFVNPLVPESPEEEEIFKQGELNKLKRIDFSTASLLKMAPTAEERNVIHDIFLNTLDTKEDFPFFLLRCSRPFIVSVDDIMFQRPVEVGSLLLLSGQVCYTEKIYIQVRVHSEVYDADTREHHTTNIFHFTFMSENEVPRVVPKTYGGKYPNNALSR